MYIQHFKVSQEKDYSKEIAQIQTLFQEQLEKSFWGKYYCIANIQKRKQQKLDIDVFSKSEKKVVLKLNMGSYDICKYSYVFENMAWMINNYHRLIAQGHTCNISYRLGKLINKYLSYKVSSTYHVDTIPYVTDLKVSKKWKTIFEMYWKIYNILAVEKIVKLPSSCNLENKKSIWFFREFEWKSFIGVLFFENWNFKTVEKEIVPWVSLHFLEDWIIFEQEQKKFFIYKSGIFDFPNNCFYPATKHWILTWKNSETNTVYFQITENWLNNVANFFWTKNEACERLIGERLITRNTKLEKVNINHTKSSFVFDASPVYSILESLKDNILTQTSNPTLYGFYLDFKSLASEQLKELVYRAKNTHTSLAQEGIYWDLRGKNIKLLDGLFYSPYYALNREISLRLRFLENGKLKISLFDLNVDTWDFEDRIILDNCPPNEVNTLKMKVWLLRKKHKTQSFGISISTWLKTLFYILENWNLYKVNEIENVKKVWDLYCNSHSVICEKDWNLFIQPFSLKTNFKSWKFAINPNLDWQRMNLLKYISMPNWLLLFSFKNIKGTKEILFGDHDLIYDWENKTGILCFEGNIKSSKILTRKHWMMPKGNSPKPYCLVIPSMAWLWRDFIKPSLWKCNGYSTIHSSHNKYQDFSFCNLRLKKIF